ALAAGDADARLADQRRAAARMVEANIDQLDPRPIRDHRLQTYARPSHMAKKRQSTRPGAVIRQSGDVEQGRRICLRRTARWTSTWALTWTAIVELDVAV
ncbi:MAG TPA: hypothetical protein VF516_19460, partial [Kofleriaceae bacterium]